MGWEKLNFFNMKAMKEKSEKGNIVCNITGLFHHDAAVRTIRKACQQLPALLGQAVLQLGAPAMWVCGLVFQNNYGGCAPTTKQWPQPQELAWPPPLTTQVAPSRRENWENVIISSTGGNLSTSTCLSTSTHQQSSKSAPLPGIRFITESRVGRRWDQAIKDLFWQMYVTDFCPPDKQGWHEVHRDVLPDGPGFALITVDCRGFNYPDKTKQHLGYHPGKRLHGGSSTDAWQELWITTSYSGIGFPEAPVDELQQELAAIGLTVKVKFASVCELEEVTCKAVLQHKHGPEQRFVTREAEPPQDALQSGTTNIELRFVATAGGTEALAGLTSWSSHQKQLEECWHKPAAMKDKEDMAVEGCGSQEVSDAARLVQTGEDVLAETG